mmetsp:Transcript_10893/g.21107  ORF Transcript_10893/g.21107 Transcript_10893/m.21107 type:complete len:142 (+) Transcript_10893:41-466(+)
MEFLICFDIFLGRKMNLVISKKTKKDSVCFYFDQKLNLVFLNTGQLKFSINSSVFLGFLFGINRKISLLKKSGQIFKNKGSLCGCIYVFRRKKFTIAFKKNFSQKNGKWLNSKENFFLEKSLAYLFDRKNKKLINDFSEKI